jgi:hypothetical protein
MQSLTHRGCHHINVVVYVYAGHGQCGGQHVRLDRQRSSSSKRMDDTPGFTTAVSGWCTTPRWCSLRTTRTPRPGQNEHGMCSVLEPVGCPLSMHSQLPAAARVACSCARNLLLHSYHEAAHDTAAKAAARSPPPPATSHQYLLSLPPAAMQAIDNHIY